MTLQNIIDKAYDLVGTDEDKRHAALWLFLEYLEIDNTQYHLHLNSELGDNRKTEYFELLNKYIKDNIPVQYLIGHSYFYNRRFIVNKNTLIPRSETDFLVDEILKLMDKHYKNKALKILDLGTGSGVIGITIKLERPNSEVTLSDISKSALTVAKANAKEYNVLVEVIESSWFNNITEKFDVIIANPPYVAEHFEIDKIVAKEPYKALYGGVDGLDPYRIILKEVDNYLNNKGIIAFEHGYDHKKALNKLALKYFPKSFVIQKQDLGKRDRYTFILKGEMNE